MKTLRKPFAWIFFVGFALLSATALSEIEDGNEREITIVTWRSSSNFKVEVADTPEKWSRGLSGATSPSDDTGLLFLFPEERIYPFSMKGTDFGADVLLIDAAGQVVQIYKELSDDIYHVSSKPALALLFIKEGLCDKLEIREGCLVISSDNILVVRGPMESDDKHEESALKKLRSVAKTQLEDDLIQLEVAEFLLGIGKPEDAKKYFDGALEIKKSARAHVGLGVILGNNNKFDAAEKHLLKAIELEPLNMDAFAKLKKLKRQYGGLQTVIDLLKEAVKNYPESLEVNRQLARLYLETNDLDGAANTIQDGLLKFDKDGAAELARVMGDVHLRRGNMREAAEEYLKFLSVFPNAPHSQELRTFILVHKVKKESTGQTGDLR